MTRKGKAAEGFLKALKEGAFWRQRHRVFQTKGGSHGSARELGRKTLPRLLFKKNETKISGNEQTKKKFLDELKKGIHEGVRVSWDTKSETEALGKKRKKAVESWLINSGLSSVPVRLQEMSSTTATIERPAGAGKSGGVKQKGIPRGKNPCPGCRSLRRPFNKNGKEGCAEGSEIRNMKTGVKCCYKKGRGAPRKKLGTSIATPKKGSETLLDVAQCMKYSLVELQTLRTRQESQAEERKRKSV
uniref:D6/D11 helicase n=1 Tax=Giant Blood Marseillevirus TaxID=1370064 RepID=S5RMU4_9VIRU|nr:D6/D11 helicase [Giant Blood Marseillevirus]